MQGLGDLAMRMKSQVGSRDPTSSSLQVEADGAYFSVGKLAKVKQFALRRKVWFRSLSRVERGVFDLTIKYVDSVKSSLLAKVLTAILEKLQFASASFVDRVARSFGCALARKAAGLAAGFGNRSARAWASDADFARFLAVMHLNEPRVVGASA